MTLVRGYNSTYTPPFPRFPSIKCCSSPSLLLPSLQQHPQRKPTLQPLADHHSTMVSLSSTTPSWLESLISDRFFSPCPLHESARKNERNILCLDCCSAFCPHCLSPHSHHRLLQIRRYVYHDVARVDDLQRLIDCSSVQSYTANGAKVVFLSNRPQTRPFRGGAGHHACSSCDRPLPYPFRHCSLACKVRHVVRREGDIAGHLRQCEVLALSDDGQLSPDSMLDYGGGETESGSSGEGPGIAAGTPGFTVRKRRSRSGGGGGGGEAVSRIGSEGVNRRKRVPVRAPLF